jgi:hypothetical protein
MHAAKIEKRFLFGILGDFATGNFYVHFDTCTWFGSARLDALCSKTLCEASRHVTKLEIT